MSPSGAHRRLGTAVAAAVVLALPLACASEPAAPLRVVGAWVRAVPPVAPMTAGYLRIENDGPADALVGASSPQAERVELHETVTSGDRVAMEPRDRLEVPAGGTLELRPGGAHLMLRGYRAPEGGGTVELRLRFASGRESLVAAPVERR